MRGPLVTSSDSLMLVLARNEDDTGFIVGWSPVWIKKCQEDPKCIEATVQALGVAMVTFAEVLAQQRAPVVQPSSKAVN